MKKKKKEEWLENPFKEHSGVILGMVIGFIIGILLIILSSCATTRQQKQANKYWYYRQIQEEKVKQQVSINRLDSFYR